MSLVGLKGDRDHHVIDLAIQNQPSLIIDCANKASPHSFFPQYLPENLNNVYVIEVDLIYSFRDVLKNAKRYVKELGAKLVVVTSFDYLFNYGDEEENREVLEHTWELMQELAREVDVVVSTGKDKLAKRYCEVRT